MSTPKSIDEEESRIDDADDFFDSSPKKKPPLATIERSEKHISQAQIHKRPLASNSSTTESKSKPSATDHSSTAPSSIFKLTEPPVSKSKPRATRDLDEKWSDMFGNNKQEESAKDDLLAKLVADEQKERRLATTTQPPPPAQRPSMTMFESSTRSTSKFLFPLFPIRIYLEFVLQHNQQQLNQSLIHLNRFSAMIQKDQQHLGRKISMIFSLLNHPIRQQQQQHKHVGIHSNLYLVQHLQQIIILMQQAHQMTDYNDRKSCTMQLNPYRIEQSSTKWKNSFCEQRLTEEFFCIISYFLLSVVLYQTKISSENKDTIDMRARVCVL